MDEWLKGASRAHEHRSPCGECGISVVMLGVQHKRTDATLGPEAYQHRDSSNHHVVGSFCSSGLLSRHIWQQQPDTILLARCLPRAVAVGHTHRVHVLPSFMACLYTKNLFLCRYVGAGVSDLWLLGSSGIAGGPQRRLQQTSRLYQAFYEAPVSSARSVQTYDSQMTSPIPRG